MGWTTQDYQAFLCRNQRRPVEAPADAQDALDELTAGRREADLHKLILAECARRNWVAFHGSMAHKTKRSLGEPDFVILLPQEKVLLVECKTRKGTLSTAQQEILLRAALLGHYVHTVRSFADFCDVMKRATGN